ncbi:hypothetical protein KEM54_005236 [Ascosphaera aggregata]|nr:hypothetical protein KEM54_005236 [Ascosphaera aggregata]
MNPHQQNKIDLSKLTPDEQRLLRLYGKLPTKKDLLQNKLKVNYIPTKSRYTDPPERKYFDSGDYALSKAGKASDVGVTTVGSRHPVPENIPHATAASTSPPTASPSPVAPAATAHSPMKESSVLTHDTSSDDLGKNERTGNQEQPKQTVASEQS